MSKIAKIALTFILLIGNANAFSITPENPAKGDVVTIHGITNPNENIKIEILFEEVVEVQNGKYAFSVKDVKIPEGKNKFSVSAYGCEDLKVGVWILVGWITPLSSKASNGVASVSLSNVPAGTYDILVHGKANSNSVKLKIVATGYIKANDEGKFSYSYDTSCIPPGEFVIRVNGEQKRVVLAENIRNGARDGNSAIQGSAIQISTPAPPTPIPPTPTSPPVQTLTPKPTFTAPESKSAQSTPKPQPITQSEEQPRQGYEQREVKTTPLDPILAVLALLIAFARRII